jgi:hypothetical protein
MHERADSHRVRPQLNWFDLNGLAALEANPRRSRQ